MPYPKRLRLHRMQVIFRRPNANERGPLGESYADIPWSASLEERADGRLILRLTSHTHPSHSDVLQAVICGGGVPLSRRHHRRPDGSGVVQSRDGAPAQVPRSPD